MEALNNTKAKQILISIGIVLLIGVIIYFVSNKGSVVGPNTYFGINSFSTTTSAEAQSGDSVSKIYKDTKFEFSIRIPKDAKTTNFQEGEGYNILIQDTKYQMQIYVSSFDENVGLTIARVKKDIPDIKMESPMEIETASTPTVAFISHDRGAPYREIWFVSKGYLYQVLAPAGEDPMTATIMQSWVWN